MFRQKGRFVIPSISTCHIPLNEQSDFKQFLFRARVPAEHKQKIRDELAKRQINRADMYIDENPERQNFITEINKTIFNL